MMHPSDGSDIAEQMMKDIPACLRVRMAMDVLITAVTIEQRDAIEQLLSTYLAEAEMIERDFDYDGAMGI